MATILLIDDNPLVRNSLMRHLSMAGHAVVAASDGLAGIAALEREAIDLIVTDIVMPDCDGIDFIRRRCQVSATNQRSPKKRGHEGGRST